MVKNKTFNLTEQNLEKLADILSSELSQDSALAEQIPDGAHIFHGAYDDKHLTEANLELAARTSLGMALGYVEASPLVMIFEQKPKQYTAIELSNVLSPAWAKSFIRSFEKQSQQEVAAKIAQAVAA
jgi:hypothetical protein